MTRVLKIVGWLLVLLVAVAGAAVIAANVLAQRKLERSIDVKVAPVAYVNDPAAIERGRYLFHSRGCGDCHGANGAGRLFIDEPNGFRVSAPNLTTGSGSAVAGYTEADWERAIRHGVRRGGRPIFIMPSEDFNRLTDADLAAIVAYARQLPAAEGPGARVELPLMLRALYAAGVIRDAAEKIDHSLPPEKPVAEAVTLEHGAYVAHTCKGCHGLELKGGKIPGAPPDWPPAADLTAASTYAIYTDTGRFRAMMRSGKRPDGGAIQVMPFESLKQINDTDLDALYLYLSALPKSAAAR